MNRFSFSMHAASFNVMRRWHVILKVTPGDVLNLFCHGMLFASALDQLCP